MRSGLVVRLSARGRVFGALSPIRTGPGAGPIMQDDVDLALEIGRRAGTDVDNAARYTGSATSRQACSARCCPSCRRCPACCSGRCRGAPAGAVGRRSAVAVTLCVP